MRLTFQAPYKLVSHVAQVRHFHLFFAPTGTGIWKTEKVYIVWSQNEKTRNWNLKFEVEAQNRNSKSKLEIETWSRSSKSKLEVETWSGNSKSKLEVQTRSGNSKSKLEVETSISTWSFNFRLEINIIFGWPFHFSEKRKMRFLFCTANGIFHLFQIPLLGEAKIGQFGKSTIKSK